MCENELNILCNNFQTMMLEMEDKMQVSVKRQSETFMIAFRKARDRIINELRLVQERVKIFMLQLQNEDKVITYVQKELEFFREQSLNLDDLRKEMQARNQYLVKQNETLVQEREEQIKVLYKVKDENIILKSTIQQLREQGGGQATIQRNPEQYQRNKIAFKTISHTPPCSRSRSPFTKAIKGPYLQNDSIVGQDRSTIKESFIGNIVRVPSLKTNIEDEELHQLFKESVKNLRREIQQRKIQQRGKKRIEVVTRNSENMYELPDLENQFIKITKFDQRELMERFLTSKRFLNIVEAKIFNIKCCQNQNCLFNYPAYRSDKQVEPEDINNNLSQIRLGDSALQRIRYRSSHNTVGRDHLESHRPEWMDINHVQDKRIQYQICFSEMRQLERDLTTSSRKDKSKHTILKKRISEVTDQLSQISHRMKYNDVDV